MGGWVVTGVGVVDTRGGFGWWVGIWGGVGSVLGGGGGGGRW